jgi:starch synthase
VKAIYDWYDQNKRQFMPDGSIILQSSSAHQWPYPAYLYGKGSWAAVDVLYFMPDIPITFMGEIDGEVYRIGTTQVFQHEMQETSGATGGLKRTNS